MKLQRTTLILLLLALGLGSFVYFYEVKGAQQREAAKAKEGQIFSFAEDQIQSFTVVTPQQSLNIQRVQKPGNDLPLGQWQIKAPIETTASDASVSYLLNLLVKGKSDRTFPVLANQLQEYGLDNPQATVNVKLKNQQNHQLMLGKRDYNGDFLYAQADPPSNNQRRQVLLVPVSFEYAVKRPLSEWKETSSSPSATPSKQPLPQNSSPTPSPSATPSLKPVPHSSPTSSPSATPSLKPVPQKSGQATPSATPSQLAPSKSDKATPSP